MKVKVGTKVLTLIEERGLLGFLHCEDMIVVQGDMQIKSQNKKRILIFSMKNRKHLNLW